MSLRLWITAVALAVLAMPAVASSVMVGPSLNGSYIVPTRQLVQPAGKSVEFNGRPVDILLSPNGKFAFAKDNRGLISVDVAQWKIIKESGCPGGAPSMHGLAITRDGSTVYVTTSSDTLCEAKIGPDGSVEWGRKIAVKGSDSKDSKPALSGVALSPDEKTAYVCVSKDNSLAVVDLAAGSVVKQIPVGVAPFDVALSPDGSTAYVSNWGGRRVKEGELTAKSGGTDTLVDKRGIASSGTVSIVDLNQGLEVSQVPTGLHPSDLDLSTDGRTLYVANANSDTVSVIDTQKRKVTETIKVRPDAKLPFGSAPNALTLSPDNKTLYVANGGNNAIAVITLSANKGSSAIKGFIPTAWYPGAVATDGQTLFIANIKGYGSRYAKPGQKGFGVHAHLGTLGKVAIPNAAQLKTYTAQVKKDALVPQTLLALERSSTGKKPVPVPAKVGEPSVFEHVVYIIKENKTYDQVFGDIGKGNSDPSLCIYGREASPNHHALAEQFVLLDNYYCNGVCSADGHQWVTQGNATDYLEKSFGGWPRSYPFSGDDCLSYSSSGMIWDNVISHGLSFRNYGEMDRAGLALGAKWADVYKDYLNKTRTVAFTQSIAIDALRQYSCPDYPGWNLQIPDVLRADIFLKEFREYEKKGNWPSFVIVYLPVDHTTGGAVDFPIPSAQVADNDLAMGRIIEAISKSKFWPKTAIFVEEDDAQSGTDHVDGHRSICLVVSPYTKRNAVVSEFYSQTSVLHTMEQILGIPPMNQMDAMSNLMTDCFTTKPDFTPYTCVPNRIPLDQMVKKEGLNFGDGSQFARDGKGDAFAYPDIINDDAFNRALWVMAKGPSVPYPAEWAGPHGRGLKALGLELNGVVEDDDD